MLTIWGRKSSSNVQALMWCVGELGLDYVRHDVGHRYGGNDTPEFLAMNPNGTVPVLQDGDGEPLFETGAILRYLASRYASSPFWPNDLAGRTRVDMWAEWSKVNIAQEFTAPIFWRVVRTAPKDHDPAAIAKAMGVLGAKLDIAEQRLANHTYLVGDELTLADIQFGHVLFRYFDIDITRPERPALHRYYQNLTTRPAFREHVMVSYEELRVL
ncbi:glutathione S-transferase family protein [Agrobacterium vitis]|uniref:glutathione S-transferase family protein n=1 Tax=Agrobacterium vitis TaxID=373 RepID=UPI0012E72FA1|nr:glutathione S-transferase family protein [Agrobacterium vitis]MVA24567.1 glutathione S-transferase [Agrobacterium vitis]